MTIPASVWVPIGPSPIAQGGRQDNGLSSAIAVNPLPPDRQSVRNRDRPQRYERHLRRYQWPAGI
jgi:hypothetical protein